nr:hypothetical protein [Tanacetum cinerariifolium]
EAREEYNRSMEERKEQEPGAKLQHLHLYIHSGREADAAYLRKKVIYDVESREENGGMVGRSRTSLYSLNGKRKVKESRFLALAWLLEETHVTWAHL